MRRRIPAVLWTLLLAASCVPPDPAPTADQDVVLMDEIGATVTAFVEALNAHDTDAIMEFYAPDVDLVRLGCTNVVIGRETIEGRIAIYHQQRKDVTFSMEVAYVKPLTPVSAIATVRGGTSTTAGLFWSLGMVKQADGQWRIAYEHQSWPDCPAAGGYHAGGVGPRGVGPDSID